MQNSDFEVYRDLPQKAERNWGMFSHLSALFIFTGIPFANILGPLVMWLIKKDEMPYAADQAKEALNFQISMTIYLLISIVLMIVAIGFVLAPAVILTNFIYLIVAAVKANDGLLYRYPLTIRLVN